jgi:hypothetical protein
MMTVRDCFSIFANASSNTSYVLEMKNTFSVPSAMLLGIALVLATLIQLAMILSKFFNCPNSVLYFNISLVDALMAATGFPMVLGSANSSTWKAYTKITIIFVLLR